MTGVKKVEFDAKTNIATVVMKKGKTIEKKDAEKAFDGSKFAVTSFDEVKEEKKEAA